jgi:hypothetical protein
MLPGPLQPAFIQKKTLAGPLQPVFAFRITKNGKLPTGQKDMGQLTETPSHAWSRVHPKT